MEKGLYVKDSELKINQLISIINWDKYLKQFMERYFAIEIFANYSLSLLFIFLAYFRFFSAYHWLSSLLKNAEEGVFEIDVNNIFEKYQSELGQFASMGSFFWNEKLA